MSDNGKSPGPRLEQLAERARNGERDALDEPVPGIQNDVYHLAVRMLWCPEDARDATQEILIKAITHLGTFRGESTLRTWIYRITTNHLLNAHKSRVEREAPTFSSSRDDLGGQMPRRGGYGSPGR